jgi:hypothetical protein
MQLQFVDKTRYRKHLNIVILGFITTLLVLSLAYGTLFIKLFSDLSLPIAVTTSTTMNDSPQKIEPLTPTPVAESDVVVLDYDATRLNEETTEFAAQESNFKYNFLGVFLALLSCGVILNKLKRTSFFTEIYYVWQMKQVHNKIFRKLKYIKKALKNDDETAMLILTFYYQGLIQIYQLDDNTITMPTLTKDIEKLEAQISEKGISVNIEDFELTMVKSFS